MILFELLCVLCKDALRDPLKPRPLHVVNPQCGTPRLYDIWSRAMCPTCGILWYRGKDNNVVIMGEVLMRKPPKRALTAKPVPKRAGSKAR
jgi:hypothetical protein